MHGYHYFCCYGRWREEQEMEATRHSERVRQLEQEKLDSVAAERKKLEALEISKNNEIEKLQAIHRYTGLCE